LIEKYRSISVKTELADFIEQYIKKNPQYGYRSISQFMEDAARQRLEDLKALTTPQLEHYNLNEKGVLILDRSLDRIIQVYFKPDRVLCEYDETNDCRHVQFALELPEVQELLRKRGWKTHGA